MNLRQRGSLFLALMVAFVFIAVVLDAGSDNGALASPAPGRRGGGGSRGRSSSSSRGSSSSSSYGRGSSSSSGSGGYKKKSSTKSKLKKAAVLGATAYGAYQLGKLSGRFSSYGGYGGGSRYGWNDYNRWREVDGFMCRDSNDCNWIDRQLYCQDYELEFTPNAGWFGGDWARIVGECACPRGMVFNEREMQCQTAAFGSIGYIIGVVFVGILVLLCACGCCFFAARKFM